MSFSSMIFGLAFAIKAIALLLFRLKFPKYVYDDPSAVELCHMQIVYPIRRNDLDAGCTLEYIKNRYILLLFFLGSILSPATPRPLHQRHRTHLVKSALSILICANDSFR